MRDVHLTDNCSFTFLFTSKFLLGSCPFPSVTFPWSGCFFFIFTNTFKLYFFFSLSLSLYSSHFFLSELSPLLCTLSVALHLHPFHLCLSFSSATFALQSSYSTHLLFNTLTLLSQSVCSLIQTDHYFCIQFSPYLCSYSDSICIHRDGRGVSRQLISRASCRWRWGTTVCAMFPMHSLVSTCTAQRSLRV